MLQRRRLSGGCYPVLESEPRLAAPQSNSAVQHQGGGGGRGVVDFGTRVHPRPKLNQATLWLKPRLATRTAWWWWSSLKQPDRRGVSSCQLVPNIDPCLQQQRSGQYTNEVKSKAKQVVNTGQEARCAIDTDKKVRPAAMSVKPLQPFGFQ